MPGRIEIAFAWLGHGRGLEAPAQHSAGAAGVDLRAALPEGETVTLAPGQRATLPCGFAMALPQGYEAQVRSRSGLASRNGVAVLNAPGTIDADYRGEVMVVLINHGTAPFEVRRGDRIAQMVVAPVVAVSLSERDALEATERGAAGFGSTGR